MNLEDRKIEDTDMKEEYEMIPLESMMYGYGQMGMSPDIGMNPNMDMSPNMDMDPNMGMPMGYMQDTNLNMGMNPWMGMQPSMGMNQFNEGIFMNSFNPMGMMYGEASNNDYEDEDLRQLDKEPFKDEYNNPNKFNPKYNDVDFIVRRIERYNPAIFRRLTRCGIPYGEVKEIVRRIVRLTLMYRDE